MSEENKGMEIKDAAPENAGIGENSAPQQLSEAELAGVSGGVSQEALEMAQRICGECRRDAVQSCDGGGPEILALDLRYVRNYVECPYACGPFG